MTYSTLGTNIADSMDYIYSMLVERYQSFIHMCTYIWGVWGRRQEKEEKIFSILFLNISGDILFINHNPLINYIF